MKYAVNKQKRYVVLHVQENNLNSVVAPDLKSQFVIMRQEGISSFILDLTGVDFIDSSGLSAILTAHRMWKGDGCFVITGELSDQVKKLINISQLSTVLTIIPTVHESIEYAIMSELERELGAEDGAFLDEDGEDEGQSASDGALKAE